MVIVPCLMVGVLMPAKWLIMDARPSAQEDEQELQSENVDHEKP